MRRIASILVVVVFVVSVSMSAIVDGDVVTNISTGIDRSTGLQLTGGASDPNWVVATGGDGGPYLGQHLIAKDAPLPPPYMADNVSTGSRWDVINSGLGQQGFSVNGVLYYLQTSVDLTCFDPKTASIPTARFGVDDLLGPILVNNTIAYAPPSNFGQGFDRFYDTLPANIGLGDFHAGVNTITFEVQNVFGSPMALRLEANLTATAVPEPRVMTMLLAPAAFTLVRRRAARA